LELLAAKLGNISLAPSSSSSSHPSSSSDPQQRVIVTSSSWFSDVVLPVIVSGIVVIIALFAVIVLLLLRRHLQLERESLAAADEDRSALTPGSVRRHSPLMQLDITQHLARLQHHEQQQQAMEAAEISPKAYSSAHVLRPLRDDLFLC
jgi:flagellar biosynthesis/type III secretory pathway M-ring protein FliF/YscJ